MCVVALALYQHPDWPIVLVGNRDEYHARASAPLHAWDDGSGIVAGRDLVGGGTWLGVVPAQQRMVVVTNARGERGRDPDKVSRGVLVRDLLTASGDFAAPHPNQLELFNGFNLMAVAGAGAQVMTNRPDANIRQLEPAVHAIANEVAGRACDRSARLAAAVRLWLASGQDPAVLLDTLRAEDGPALFLNDSIYGTRCSTLVAIATDGSGQIVERRYERGGLPTGETALKFQFGL
ncbi:MAG: NRDE family protein [Sphingopyxis sp.]|nr:NRDE family protein [Sphingopyxis sp.]